MTRPDWYCDDVLSGKLGVRRVYEDEHVLAFHHPRPAREVHVVIVSKRHVASLLDASALDGLLLMSMIRAVQFAAKTLNLSDGKGFYVRANAGAEGVTPHIHWHLLGPGAGADWPEQSAS